MVTNGIGGSVSLGLAYENGVRVNTVPAARLNGSVDAAIWMGSASPSAVILPPGESGGIGAGLVRDPGHYEILLVGSGKRLTEIYYEIEPQKVTWKEVGRGSDVVYFDLGDLAGGAGASANAFVASASAGGLRGHTERVEGNFFGWYGSTLTPAQPAIMTASSDAQTRSCPCTFYDVVDPTVLGAGDWRFEWSGARADLSTPILVGADVAWPGITQP